MIVEKQNELIILDSIIKKCSWKNTFVYNNIEYDKKKILKRYKELMAEFLETYTINKT